MYGEYLTYMNCFQQKKVLVIWKYSEDIRRIWIFPKLAHHKISEWLVVSTHQNGNLPQQKNEHKISLKPPPRSES